MAWGEVELTVCGKQRSLAWTGEVILAIESRLQIGMPMLQARILNGDVRFGDLSVIVSEGLRGAGHGGANGKGEAAAKHQIAEDIAQNFGAYCNKVGEFFGHLFPSK